MGIPVQGSMQHYQWVSFGLLGGLHDHTDGKCDYNLMLTVYGNWLTRERVRLYSGAGYGTMGGYVNGEGRPSFGFQVTPVGVSYGKRLFGFAEIGTGWMFCPARAGIGYGF